MSFRLVDQNPVYFDLLGNLCADGTLTFYETTTTTPKSVYGEPGLSTDLGNIIDIGSDGRAEDDVWLASDLAYTVVLKNAIGAEIWTRDDVRATDADAFPTLPDPADGADGQVLGIDGGEYALLDVEGLPDPTGFPLGYLATDGAIWFPATLPVATVYDNDDLPGSFTQTNTSSGGFTFGNIRVQWGSDTAPTSATVLSTKAVTFGVAFSGAPYYVGVTPTAGGVTSDTPAARCSAQATGANTTGFTASVFAGAEDEGHGATNITATVGFGWLAIGPK